MNERSSGPQRGPSRGGRHGLTLRDRAEWLQRRAMRFPPVRRGLDVQRAYDQAGGTMLAAGLSFFALFTLVPALLLFVSVLGLVFDSAARRQEIVDAVVAQVPPLEEVAEAVLAALAGGAQAGTLLGLVGLIWGASGFYGALEGAMARLFPGMRTRDVVATRVRGVFAVALLMGALIGAVLVGSTAALVASIWGVNLGAWGWLLGPAAAITTSIALCLVVYVLVPANGPSLFVALVPAVTAGTVMGLLTSFFGTLTPFLVRNAAALGIIGAVFASLVWFELTFQVLLYGAAFARTRRDAARIEALEPRI